MNGFEVLKSDFLFLFGISDFIRIDLRCCRSPTEQSDEQPSVQSLQTLTSLPSFSLRFCFVGFTGLKFLSYVLTKNCLFGCSFTFWVLVSLADSGSRGFFSKDEPVLFLSFASLTRFCSANLWSWMFFSKYEPVSSIILSSLFGCCLIYVFLDFLIQMWKCCFFFRLFLFEFGKS